MRRFHYFLAALSLLFLAGLPLGAQMTQSPYFAKSVSIMRVFSHQKGYRIVYWTQSRQARDVYIPIEWFSRYGDYLNENGSPKAELHFGPGPTFPYMTIFWKEGKFSHVRLFLNVDYRDSSWGVIPQTEDWSSRFDPSSTPQLRF